MTAEIKTYAGWETSGLDLSRYLAIGDVVDDEMMGYFRDVLPPAYHTWKIIQIGEPYSHVGGKETYSTIEMTGNGWVYRGHCWKGKVVEP